MTTPDAPDDPGPDADPLDDLASALVDGEATADERARADEPEVAARVAAFDAVARRVGAPVTPPGAAASDAAVAAALAAADARPAPPSLDARRRRRRLPPWLAQAAAALLAVAGLGILAAVVGSGGDDADDAATDAATEESASSRDTAGGGGDTAGEAGGLEGTVPDERAPTGAGSNADLGSFDDEAALVDAARAVPPASTSADDGGAPAELDTCSGALRDGAVSTATATLRGRRVLVTVGPPPAREVVAVDASTCEELVAESP